MDVLLMDILALFVWSRQGSPALPLWIGSRGVLTGSATNAGLVCHYHATVTKGSIHGDGCTPRATKYSG
jgi:hypothetical protein